MEFIDELKNDSICAAILNDIEEQSWQDVQIKFTTHEADALSRVAFFVYNSFCNNSDDDDGLSLEVNHFLDNLNSARKKINSAF